MLIHKNTKVQTMKWRFLKENGKFNDGTKLNEKRISKLHNLPIKLLIFELFK